MQVYAIDPMQYRETLEVELASFGCPVGRMFVEGNWVKVESVVEGRSAILGYNAKSYMFSASIDAGRKTFQSAEMYKAIRDAVDDTAILDEEKLNAEELVVQFERYRDKDETYHWRGRIPLADELFLFISMGYVEKVKSGRDPNASVYAAIYGKGEEFHELWNQQFPRSETPKAGTALPCGSISLQARYPHRKWALLVELIDRVRSGDFSGFTQNGYVDRSSSIRNGEHVTAFNEVVTSLDPQDAGLQEIIRSRLQQGEAA